MYLNGCSKKMCPFGIATISNKTFLELKKKYTGEKEDEQVH